MTLPPLSEPSSCEVMKCRCAALFRCAAWPKHHRCSTCPELGPGVSRIATIIRRRFAMTTPNPPRRSSRLAASSRARVAPYPEKRGRRRGGGLARRRSASPVARASQALDIGPDNGPAPTEGPADSASTVPAAEPVAAVTSPVVVTASAAGPPSSAMEAPAAASSPAAVPSAAASPAVAAALSPLFLGLAEGGRESPSLPTVAGSPRPPLSDGVGLPAFERETSEERQRRYEAELARSETPLLSPPAPGMPAYAPSPRPGMRVDTPSDGRYTPPEPVPLLRPREPQGPHAPSWTEVSEWAQCYWAPVLLIEYASGDYPEDWIVTRRDAADRRIRATIMRRLTEGSSPWPTWSCERCATLGVP